MTSRTRSQHHKTNEKGTNNVKLAERGNDTQSFRSGAFATLRAFFGGEGTSAPSTDLTNGTGAFSGSQNRSEAGEAVRNQAAQGRREGSVLCTRPTEDVEMRRVTGGRSAVRRLALVAALASVACLLAAGPAAAAPSPWWHLTQRLITSKIAPGGEGTILLQAANIGNAPTAGPATVSAELPPNITIVEEGGAPKIEFFASSTPAGLGGDFGPRLCSVSGRTVTCQTEPVVPGAYEKFIEKLFDESPLNTPPFNEPPIREAVIESLEAEHPKATFEEEVIKPVIPYEFIEMKLGVKAEPGAGGAEPVRFSASGGGAPPAAIVRPVPVGSGPVPYGLEHFALTPEVEGGAVATRAGSHPYQLTTDVTFNRSDPNPFKAPAPPRNLHFNLPPGQLGNATITPKCSGADFATLLGEGPNLCPADTVIGATLLTFSTTPGSEEHQAVPLFNLQPALGEPARFGFVAGGGTPVILDTHIRSGKAGTPEGDYGVTVDVPNITELVSFLSATTVFWGAPDSPSHNESRGWSCISGEKYFKQGTVKSPCEPSSDPKPPAFLTLPTNCAAPFSPGFEGNSWPTRLAPAGFTAEPLSSPLQDEAGDPLGLTACNQVPFDPRIEAEPTSDAATSATGLNVSINFQDEGLLNDEGVAQSQIKKVVVALPEGFTTNPSVAEGLKACSEAEYESTTVESGGCTEESKIGDVEIESPLVEQKVKGSLFVAKQGENPNGDAQHPGGNLLTIYLVARNPEIGVLVRQALKVTPNPVTGQLTTEVDNVPELPFSHFELSFRQGQRSPLVTPPACGTYAVKAALSPWSNPASVAERESSFKITTGPEGQGCPSGGVPPFHPVLEAGTLNNAAGTYSPFVTHITRKDSEQEITRFSIKLPTGMIAKLKGVSECTDAQIAQAKSREVEGGGTVEQEHPSCPANSEIGHSLVGSGVGNVLAYAPGKLYFAGPYHGSPISIVSITAAKVGPFDLGTVVVRFALDVNHETAEVSVDGANSDPIPHIVDGIPIHLRDLRAYVDRQNFTLNPTSCAKKSTAATILGSGLNFASSSDDVPVTVSSPFQAADCASLGFKPKLALNLVGKKTHRGALPAFKAVLTYPKQGAYANIAAAQVTLPKSEFLEQGHLKNVCTRKVFETGKTPGENCPKNSIYGKARAVTPLLDAPLEGPVYLRTGYGTRLPELAAALNGPQISITLAGTIDSVHKKGSEGSQIRNTFALVPDAPVEKFTLELKGGKKGLLVNSTDVCKGTHKALAAFTGQNGKLDEYEPALKAQCGKGAKKGKKSGGKKKAGK
jgi:hypothetical protein